MEVRSAKAVTAETSMKDDVVNGPSIDDHHSARGPGLDGPRQVAEAESCFAADRPPRRGPIACMLPHAC